MRLRAPRAGAANGRWCHAVVVAFGAASLAGCAVAGAEPTARTERPVELVVHTGTVLHRIDPRIYGVSFATRSVLRDLNLPLNRSGGNSATLYDWRTDARNAGADFFFQSLPVTADIFDQLHHGFVAQSRAGGAASILTIPAIGWTARLGPQRGKLAAFSIRKYGAQQGADLQWFPDAGNGKHPDGTPITVNDPRDAARAVDPVVEARERVADLVARWGRAGAGAGTGAGAGAGAAGVRYYAIDNEPGLWHEAHRHVRKEGVHAAELAERSIAVARAIKASDPGAQVLAPEAWGWPEYFDSGFDVQGKGLERPAAQSDRVRETGGMDHLPWLLSQWKSAGRPVDIVSVHFYPQGGEYNDGSAGSREVQLLRNRSTRVLWDRNYRDPSWINAEIELIPRLRLWVDTYYERGVPVAITEYNWGGENSMSGATAQADIWGIFGRHGLDMAARWAAPGAETPAYKAMKLIRNPDGHGGGFGEGALAVTVPDSDTLSAFAAVRDSDRALTLLVINKSLDQGAAVRVRLAGRRGHARATAYRLAEGALASPTPAAVRAGVLSDRLPAQSIALYVVPHGR